MSLKIPVYLGVNDNPLPPNEVNNCNADYFIDKYNRLVNISLNYGNIRESSTYYLSSNGNDNNDGTVGNPILTLERLVEILDGDLVNNLILNISGTYDRLNLEKINSKNIKITTSSSLVLTGNILCPYSSNVELDFSTNITYSINKEIIIELNNSSFKINGINGLFQRISNNSITFKNGSLLLDNTKVTNGSNINQLLKLNNCSVIIKTQNINITTGVDFQLLLLDYESVAYIDGNTLGISNPITTLLDSENSTIIIVNPLFDYDSDRFFISSGTFILLSTDETIQSKIIRDKLASLTGEDRLDADNIKNIAEIDAVSIREKLQTLTNNDRLDVSAIKNINYINYYTSTSADFFQPAINGLVTVSVVNSSFLGIGNYIIIQNAGLYLVESIPNATSISIRNLGLIGNESPGTQISNDKLITITGKPGTNSFTRTTQNFILPIVGNTVNIEVETPDIFAKGSIFLVNDVDFFRVNSVTGNVLSSERLGYYTSVNPETTIVTNTKVVLGGLKGETGYNAFSFTSAEFLQPEINQTISIDVDSTLPFNENTGINIENGGTYLITSITDLNTLVIKNLGYIDNAASGEAIPLGSKVINIGLNGESAYFFTTADFTTPLYGENVNISLTTDNYLTPGVTLKIGNNGFFKVISKLGNNEISAQFLGYSTLTENTLVPLDTLVIVYGERGEKGDTGSPGLNAFSLFESFTMPNINNSVILGVENSGPFLEGQTVYVENAGYFRLDSIFDSTNVSITNLGFIGNELPGEIIPAGKIGFAGKTFNGYIGDIVGTFTMPALDDSTTFTSLNEVEWLNIGNTIYIPTIGYLKVLSININTKQITVRNEYYSENSSPSTTVNNGKFYLVLGPTPTDEIICRLKTDFVQPTIGNNVSATFYSTRLLEVGMIISGPNSGHYEIISITNSTTAVIKNTGYGLSNYVLPGTTVLANTNFKQTGSRGPTGFNATFSYLTANFTQPAINDTVQITVNDTSWMTVGQGLSIEGGGPNYSVSSIESLTTVTVKNLGYENVTAGINVNGLGSQLVTPAGIRGKDSASFITLSTNFTQPAANSNVNITVNRTDIINPYTIIAGPNSGYYRIVSINSATTLTIKNLNYPTLNTQIPGSTITAGEKLTISGEIGPTGFNATYSLLQSNFTQPTIGSNVQITVNDTSWIAINQYLYIEGGGNYQVISVDTGTTLTIKNLGYENTNSGSTITGSGTQKVSPSGNRGLNGSVSSATFLSLTHQLSNPTQTLNSVNLFSKPDQSLYTVDSTGAEHKINQDLVIGNGLNQLLSVTNVSGTNTLNLGTSNNILGNNSILNIRSNGTTPSSITLFDNLNSKNIKIIAPSNTNLASSYTLELPNNPGTNGFALVTNGSGKTSWAEITGGTLSSITDGTTNATDITTINFTNGATVTQNGDVAEINVAGGTLSSITDGTTTINDITSINIVDGATITQNGSIAEILIQGGGLETVYTSSATYNALPDTLIVVGAGTNSIILPTNPENGTKVSIADYDNRFDINPLTITAGGTNTIYDDSTLVLDTKYSTVQLVYWNTKWVLYGTESFSDTTGTTNPPPTNTLTTELVSTNFNALANYYYLVNTSGSAVIATLPDSPPSGTKIAFTDYSQTFGTNNLTINASGTNTISGETSVILSTNGDIIELVYYNGIWTSLTSSGGGGSSSVNINDIWLYGGF